MISQVDLNTIATVFGKTSDEISGAISQEGEVSLDLRLNGRVLSQEGERELKESAVQQGKEIGYKEIAKNLSIDLESGEKDPAIIAGKFTSNLSATLEEKFKKITPNEETEELKVKLSESEQKYNKLTQTYEAANGSLKEWEEKYTGLQTEIKDKELNNRILSHLPDKMRIDKSDALYITRKSLNFEGDEDNFIVKKDGEIITDAVGKPEKLENIIKSFVEDKNWINGGKGMNGGDQKSNGLPAGMKSEDAIKYIEKQGLNPMSNEGSEMYIKLTK